MRSKIARAKGLGSAHHGVSHWWWQRLTALAIVPLSLWFMYALLTLMLEPEMVPVAEWLASPVNALVTILLLAAGFFHAKLGIQVVIEDYVHTPGAKYTLLLLNTFVCITAVTVGVIAVLKLHFLDVVSATL